MAPITRSSGDALHQALLWQSSLQEGLEYLNQQHPLDLVPVSLCSEQTLVRGFLNEYREWKKQGK